MRNKILCLVLTLVFGLSAQAQEDYSSAPIARGRYSFVLYLSGGPSYYISKETAPAFLSPDGNRLGYAGTVRLMWQPDRLLKIGLESGRIQFYKYSLKDAQNKEGKLQLNATPLLLEWSMNLGKRWNIYAGSGIYILQTKLDYAGEADSRKFSAGYMAAASYIHPLSTKLGLGAEAKWYYASEATNGMITAQVQLVWRLFDY